MSRNIHCGVVEFVAHERDSSRAPLYLGYSSSSSSIAAKTTAAAVTAEAAVGGQLTAAAAAPLAAGGRLAPVVGVSPPSTLLPPACLEFA
jgi:hypothetical protein